MKFNQTHKQIFLRIVSCAVLLTTAGCFKTAKPDDSERKVFGVSVRRYEPQPVYKRTRLTYLPAPIPVANYKPGNSPLIIPVFHFELTDASLEEAARILGETSRYSSYCASTIADKRITISALGTVEELARKIARTAQIETVVDHHNREIRFLARNSETRGTTTTKPQLLN